MITPSFVTMPNIKRPYPSILEFFCARFPRIDKNIWIDRLSEGRITRLDGSPVDLLTEYEIHLTLKYYREIENEKIIPFRENIIYENDNIIVVDKPHFLPVQPAGSFINETLVNRLKKRTGINEIAPIHRIDRGTAGIVMFSKKKQLRAVYQEMFRNRKIDKTYEAITQVSDINVLDMTEMNDYIVKGEPWFKMNISSGGDNAFTRVKKLDSNEKYVLFQLYPLTGKKHQLRIQLASRGFGIINDRYYPILHDEESDDYDKPLQLLSKSIKFRDPVTKEEYFFKSEIELKYKAFFK